MAQNCGKVSSNVGLHHALRQIDGIILTGYTSKMWTTRSRRPIILVHTGQCVELGMSILVQPDLDSLNLTFAVPVRNHNTGGSNIQFPLSGLFIHIETRHTFQVTSTLQQLRHDFSRSDSRRSFITKPYDFAARESSSQKGFPVSGAQGKHREQVAVGIVPGLNGGQFKGRFTLLYLRLGLADWMLRCLFSRLENPAQFLIRCVY